MANAAEQNRMANAVRALAMDAVEKAKSGHPGLPMGAADIVTTLFRDHLKFDAGNPHWPDRDRFVLSAGHGSAMLYALLYLSGYPDITLDDIKNFRQIDSKTAGHPEHGAISGIETTTGPLGQGLGNAVGMALAERMLAARHGKALVDHHTYVLVSDGDLMEGISQESSALAGHLKLNKLIAFWDNNGISIDGPLSLADSVDQVKRFEANGWNAVHVDGHDQAAISAAIVEAKRSDKPTLIACRTTIGFGAPHKAGTAAAHGAPLGAEELAGAKKALGWNHGPFEIPDDLRKAWLAIGSRGKEARLAWQGRLEKTGSRGRAEFERVMSGTLPKGLDKALRGFKQKAVDDTKPAGSRKYSEAVISLLAEALPEFVSGSADLTPSNNTLGKGMRAIAPGDYSGSFVHYGIREHGMAAALNGLALHGGLIPASGTFLVFSDYCRPSIRLASLMEQRVIYVMTHDSIGVGEDGPTHQPVEHLAALRAIPNLRVMRPADLTETVECYENALKTANRPSLFALSRQDCAPMRKAFVAKNLSALGAYELFPAEGKAEATLFSSGSEVQLAATARETLQAAGIGTRLVSVPCMDLFLEQPESYRRRIIGRAKAKVAVEAGIRMGWDGIIGLDGLFVGMHGFGSCGPFQKVYDKFAITPEAIVAAVKGKLGR
jgi:transketolase